MAVANASLTSVPCRRTCKRVNPGKMFFEVTTEDGAQIVLRTAMKGIITGVLLAVARVAGETAPLLFTAFGNRFWNHNLSEPIAALPLQIFAYAISPYDDWHRQAWAGALVLVAMIFVVNLIVRFLTRERIA